MIIRRHILTTSPTDFWHGIDTVGSIRPSADDEVNSIYVLIASLALYRGTWRGALVCWCYVAFIGLIDVLFALVPLPVRVLSRNRPVWRVRWLCWMWLWGRRFDGPASGMVVQGEELTEEQLVALVDSEKR